MYLRGSDCHRALLVLLLSIQFVCVFGGCPSEWTASDGTTYDQLYLLSGAADFVWTGTSFTYSWNICLEQSDTSCPPETAVCKYSNNFPFTYISIGDLNTQTISDGQDGPDTGVTITYTNPLACTGNNFYTTNIYIVCDKTLSETTFEQFTPNTCVYQISMRSPYACPAKIGHDGKGKESLPSKLGGGSIFLIILLCVSVLYFGVGSLVRWKGMHKTGKDVLPQAEFWFSIPGLVKDGVLFTKNKIMSGSNTYQKL